MRELCDSGQGHSWRRSGGEEKERLKLVLPLNAVVVDHYSDSSCKLSHAFVIVVVENVIAADNAR